MKYYVFIIFLIPVIFCLSGCLKGTRKLILDVQDDTLWYLSIKKDKKGSSLKKSEFKINKNEKFCVISEENVINEKEKFIYPLLIEKNRCLYLRMKTAAVFSEKKVNKNIDCELVSLKADGKTEILTVLTLYNNYILKSRKTSLLLVDDDKVIFPYISLDKGKHKLLLLMIHRATPFKILKNEVIDTFDADLFTPFFSWNDKKNVVFYSKPVEKTVKLAGYDLRRKKVIVYDSTDGLTCPIFFNGDVYGIRNRANSGVIIKFEKLKNMIELIRHEKKIFHPFHVNSNYVAFVSSESNSRLSWLTGSVVLNVAKKEDDQYVIRKKLGIKNSGVVFNSDVFFAINGQGIYFQYNPAKDRIVYLAQKIEEMSTLADIFEIGNDYENVLKTLLYANKMLQSDLELDNNGDYRIENMKDIARVYEEMNEFPKARKYYTNIVDFYFKVSESNYSIRKKYGEEIYYLLMKQLDCMKSEVKNKYSQKFYKEYIETILRGIEFRRDEFIYVTSISAGRMLNDNYKKISKLEISVSGKNLSLLMNSRKKMEIGKIIMKLLEYTIEKAFLFDRLDEAYSILGSIYHKMGKDGAAEKIFKILNAKFPDSPYLTIEKAKK